MNSFYRWLLAPKTLAWFIGIFAVAYAITLYHRSINTDENWFGEEAYWLVHEGVVRLKTMAGIADFDKEIVVYHRLFIYIGALIIWLFGWSVFPLKIFTLLCYLAFFYVYFKFFEENKPRLTRQHFALASILIATTPIILFHASIFRPEICVMLLGFLSYFCLERHEDNRSLKWLFASGVFAGLAFFTHLNAIAFCFAGGALLLIEKKFKEFLLFAFACFLGSAYVFYDIFRGNHWSIFVYELAHWPDTSTIRDVHKGILGVFQNNFMNLLQEHKRFFWSDRVVTISLLFFVCLFFNFKMLLQKHKRTLCYLFALIIGLNLFGSHIAERYLIFHFPFMALIISAALIDMIAKPKPYLQLLCVLILAAHMILMGRHYLHMLPQREVESDIYHEIVQQIPEKHANVYALWNFIYNEIAQQHFISEKSVEYYAEFTIKRYLTDPNEFYKMFVERFNIQYVIADPVTLKLCGFEPNLPTKYENDRYVELYRRANFILLKRK